MSEIPKKINVKEVGPRDGLQNEKLILPSKDKIGWIDALSSTGLSYIEMTSFVHPDWIPQLSDAQEVAERIRRHPDVTYAALVPNQRGLERALTAGIDEAAVFMSASESHNRKNINKTIEDTFPVLQGVVDTAKSEGKTVRAYLSTVFGCPYEGAVAVDKVMKICDRLFSMGIDELSLGDTIGIANPLQVDEMLTKLLPRFKEGSVALHFHNTRGMALANVWSALQHGVTTFDASLGGLGGCPYAKGASGNLATDDLVFMLEQMGVETGIDQSRLMNAANFIEERLGKPLSSHQTQLQHSKQGGDRFVR
ncbi:hydroxymethylglutaryl-CoA lyase [Sediminibacillus dalangtanensis]|uniref:Hydroxymethylglutaryl-CoA lyase n=1 Tax=Sediminibacillus dalangtanensis TaxID=2729421 RepID=A0ABX7VVB3_9BACI|nr:hydroxymethylglutaryl-CoA lyase [Sediminibacillus dalangtanensis]QTM99530.1 hydroxymethylglutaryl-CoA lyase [Sediminibacillus dalangtanensis]